MLITKQASDYRAVAGSVHTQLVDVRLNHGRLAEPIDRYARRRLDKIKDLLQVSVKFSAKSDGSLDRQRLTTPEKLTLARQLGELAPRQLEEYRGNDFDMKEWSQRAVRILEALQQDDVNLNDEDTKFIEVELEGFLAKLLALPPEKPDRFSGRRHLSGA